MIFRRRTIAPDGPNRFVVHLGDEERAVMRAVCQDLLSVLDDDQADSPVLRRLFPSASADDAAVDDAYQALVHDDLLTSRREVLAAVADTADDRPWVVIVWNDPINLMSYVTFVLQKLFGYSLEKAESLMLDVHEKGRAVVSSGSREKAELDVFRLHEHGLWATMQHEDS